MSELFDSLNLSTSAGPSSSQQSSSQPSTSKVFWHASPSPGVLRHLHNWTPNKSQDSPILPLCTQAFVGELKKLPGALEAQSPLVSRDSAKRKLNATSRHVSDPTANKGRSNHITLELSDDEEEESVPRRLLLGDTGESSPESRRRRTMNAGHTGRIREPSSPSEHSSATRATLPPLGKDPQHASSLRRLDRRPPRRRKKESLMAGLGFTDDSGRATDCLKLFKDLQAAIQEMHASRPSTSSSADSSSTSTGQRSTVTFERGSSSEGGRLTPREGINRTTSAPSSSRMAASQDVVSSSTQQEVRDEALLSRRVFRPVKSDHDVFKAAGGTNLNSTRALQPRPTNLPTDPQQQPRTEIVKTPLAFAQSAKLSQQSQSQVQHNRKASQPRIVLPQEATKPASHYVATASTEAVEKGRTVHETTSKTVPIAQPSPVKRSARIEAMQQTSTGKKLGVRGPSLLSKSSPRKPSTTTTTLVRVGGMAAGRTRTNPLPGLSQARQPGLPRSCSQFAPTQSQSSGPAAPFRPPATSRVTVVRSSPVKQAATAAGKAFRGGQPSSSDDSFGDDDDAFLALACELEY